MLVSEQLEVGVQGQLSYPLFIQLYLSSIIYFGYHQRRIEVKGMILCSSVIFKTLISRHSQRFYLAF